MVLAATIATDTRISSGSSMLRALAFGCCLIAGVGLAPLAAQETELEEVVISGQRQPGAVIGDIAPDVQFSAQEIRALGVSNVSELLQALGPVLGSSQGRGGERPVVLLNGARISGFNEIRDLPSEAILRTDILPEEVALKYGYRATQRVVNIVLRPRFRSITAEAGAQRSSAGGRDGADLAGGLLRVQRDDRLQLDLKLQQNDELLESERNVQPATTGIVAAGAASARTLLPAVDQWSANAVWAKPLREGLTVTLNATLDAAERDSLLGLAPEPSAQVIRRTAETQDLHFGGLLNGAAQGWRWSAIINADRRDVTTLTRIESGNISRQRSDELAGELLVTGTAFTLPAGDALLNARVGLNTQSLTARSSRVGIDRVSELRRDRQDLRASLDVPLTRRADTPRLGNLSLNFNAAREWLSDFAAQETLGAGLSWAPLDQLRFLASHTLEDGAPETRELAAPVITTPGVRVFDYLRGETVQVAVIDGGNPALRADRRAVSKLAVTLRPFEERDVTLTSTYLRSTLQDGISNLPPATAEVAAAFPDRFVRDASGRLLAIDSRPVNLPERHREDLRTTLSFSLPWGPQPEAPFGNRGQRPTGASPPMQTGPIDEAARRTRMEAMGARMMGFARRGNLQMTVSHTLRLSDTASLAPGQRPLDLLAGDVLNESGALPRQEWELQFGGARNGFGGRLIVQWRDAARARTAGSELQFADFTTVNLRLFADLGLQPLAREHAWMRGVRVALVVNNVFDDKQQVQGADGSTPVNFQPDLLDPLGRNLRLTVRKFFFPASRTPERGLR
ncbi:MAG: TonB-dependent receptor [Sinobacteraceae bacterium]|nr:TonB-dependent receptor [Nevskiaceae bacterium]